LAVQAAVAVVPVELVVQFAVMLSHTPEGDGPPDPAVAPFVSQNGSVRPGGGATGGGAGGGLWLEAVP
jgi:hypothetical protein